MGRENRATHIRHSKDSKAFALLLPTTLSFAVIEPQRDTDKLSDAIMHKPDGWMDRINRGEAGQVDFKHACPAELTLSQDTYDT